VSADGKVQARRGLGRGLSALLGGGVETYADEGPLGAPTRVPIEFLRPSRLQPRRRFDEAELDALAQSIRDRGVLQPLLVRPASGAPAGYEIVAGERRWRAAQRAGQHEVPVIVRELSDQETLEVALVENLQRADLSPLEEAQAYRRLTRDFAHTQDDLADAIGKSRSHVANTMRLLTLPPAVQDLVEDGRLSAGHARALVGCPAAETLARTVIERGLNVRETEALVRLQASRPKARGRSAKVEDPNIVDLARRLTTQLGLEVGIRAKGKGGLLTIRYSDVGQLDRLIRGFQ
jgi:ParB family chromosome partitioning protein